MSYSLIETICVHLLRQCDLLCRHCWSRPSLEPGPELKPRILLAFLERLLPHGFKHLSLSGGEPTLYQPLFEVISWCQKQRVTCTITTNGYNPCRVASLAQQICGIRTSSATPIQVRISLDGDASAHDDLRGRSTFDRAVESLHILRKSLALVGVNSVTWSGLENTLSTLVPKLMEANVRQWALITETPHGAWDRASFDKTNALARFKRCGAKIRSLGFHGEITMWDYLSLPNSGALIEPEGILTLPGIRHADDIVLGPISDLETLELLLQRGVSHNLKGPVTSFL